jgi:hypothetical protein
VPAGIGILLGTQAIAANIDYVAFSDSFDTLHSDGDPIGGRSSEVGSGWVLIGGDGAYSTVSNEQGNDGQSFKQDRSAATGGYTYVQGYPDGGGVTQAGRTYTFKFDLYVADTAQSTVVGLFSGQGFDLDPSIYLAGNTWRYYHGGGYVDTTIANGAGAWNTIEIEVRNGPANAQDQYNAAVELFLTRPAGNSAGELARTSIATWTLENVAINSYLRPDFGIQSGIAYYDNVVFGFEIPVPEPTSFGLLGGLFAAFGRRRRRMRRVVDHG